MMVKILPGIIMALMVIASIPYAISGDWRHTLYWLSAATVNFAATV